MAGTIQTGTSTPPRRVSPLVWTIFFVVPAALLAGWFGLRFWVERSAKSRIYATLQPSQAADLIESWSPWFGSPNSLKWLQAEAYRKARDRGRVERITDALAAKGVDATFASSPLVLLEGSLGGPQRIREKLGPLLQLYKENGSEVLAALVEGYLIQGNTSGAGQTLSLWGELFENDFQLEFWKGVLSTRNYNLDQAVPAFRRSIELNPNFPRARHELAEVFIEQAKFEDAKSDYQWLVDRFPSNLEYITGYARCLLNLGYPDEAIEQLRKIPDVSRLPSPELSLVCEANLEAGRAEEASKQAAILLNRWPRALPYLQLQARCKAKMSQQGESEALFSKAAESQTKRPEIDRMLEQLAIDGGNQQLRMDLGEMMMTYMDPAAGVGFIQIASRTAPNNLRGHQLLAYYFDREGKTDAAAAHQQAIMRIQMAMEEAAMMQRDQEPPTILTPSGLP
jgi:tetratricopeptide (TPR) repeat protein